MTPDHDILHNAICNCVGDDAFVAWGERMM